MKTTVLLTVAIQHSSEEFLEKAISAFAHSTTWLKKTILLDLFQIILRQSWLLSGRLDNLKEKKTILVSLINSRVLGLDECVKQSVSCLHVQEACWILPLGRVMVTFIPNQFAEKLFLLAHLPHTAPCVLTMSLGKQQSNRGTPITCLRSEKDAHLKKHLHIHIVTTVDADLKKQIPQSPTHWRS